MLTRLWDHAFGTYRNGIYIGEGAKDKGYRGFYVFDDGTWETAFYKNNDYKFSYIHKETFGFFTDEDNNFICKPNKVNNELVIDITWRGNKYELGMDLNTGYWGFYDLSNSPRAIEYDPEYNTVYSVDQDTDDKTPVVRVKDLFTITGKIEVPLPIKIPTNGHHYLNDDYEMIVCNSYDGIMMMRDKDGDRWFGECKTTTPGGFGIRSSVYKGSTYIYYGLYKPNSYGSVPSQEYDNRIYVEYSIGEKGESNYLYIKRYPFVGPYICIILKDNGDIKFKCTNPNQDTIDVDQDFREISIGYADATSIKRTNYKLF